MGYASLVAIWAATIFVAIIAAVNSVKGDSLPGTISDISAPITVAPLAENRVSIISTACQN